RITTVFDEYKKEKIYEKKARKLFVKRLQFLTGNTRLSNNKDNALVGIYFSNRFLTSHSCLKGLDAFLKSQINSLDSPTLKKRLEKMSFQEGWTQKKFHKFTPKDLQEIVKVW